MARMKLELHATAAIEFQKAKIDQGVLGPRSESEDGLVIGIRWTMEAEMGLRCDRGLSAGVNPDVVRIS